MRVSASVGSVGAGDVAPRWPSPTLRSHLPLRAGRPPRVRSAVWSFVSLVDEVARDPLPPDGRRVYGRSMSPLPIRSRTGKTRALGRLLHRPTPFWVPRCAQVGLGEFATRSLQPSGLPASWRRQASPSSTRTLRARCARVSPADPVHTRATDAIRHAASAGSLCTNVIRHAVLPRPGSVRSTAPPASTMSYGPIRSMTSSTARSSSTDTADTLSRSIRKPRALTPHRHSAATARDHRPGRGAGSSTACNVSHPGAKCRRPLLIDLPNSAQSVAAAVCSAGAGSGTRAVGPLRPRPHGHAEHGHRRSAPPRSTRRAASAGVRQLGDDADLARTVSGRCSGTCRSYARVTASPGSACSICIGVLVGRLRAGPRAGPHELRNSAAVGRADGRGKAPPITSASFSGVLGRSRAVPSARAPRRHGGARASGADPQAAARTRRRGRDVSRRSHRFSRQHTGSVEPGGSLRVALIPTGSPMSRATPSRRAAAAHRRRTARSPCSRRHAGCRADARWTGIARVVRRS